MKKELSIETARTYSRLCMQPKMVAKAGGPKGNGYIEGYLAVFNNVDQGGDRIIKGAFAKSIKERVRAGKVPLMARHFLYGGDVSDAIGIITDAKEDDYGLWIHADLSAVQLAQDTRVKVEEGIVWGLSVGFQLLRYEEVEENGNWVLELKECRLLEGTVTVRPMNEEAVIHRAKALRSQLAATKDGEIPSVAPDDISVLSKSIEALLEDMERTRAPLPPEMPEQPTGTEDTFAKEADLNTVLGILEEHETKLAELCVGGYFTNLLE